MANTLVFQYMLHLKRLVTTRIKNYWSGVELYSDSPGVIFTLK